MKDVRITPISNSSVTVQITCDCGQSDMRRAGQDRQFSYYVKVNDPTFGDYMLYCQCGKKFHIVNQRAHIHVREE
jgi:hypothetical protein